MSRWPSLGTNALGVSGTEQITAAVPLTAGQDTGALVVNATINANSFPATNNNPTGVYINTTLSGNGSNQDSSNDILALLADMTVTTTGTLQQVKSFQPGLYMQGAGNITDAKAVYAHVIVGNASTNITTLTAFTSSLTQNLGTITNYYEFLCGDFSSIPGITNKFCLKNSDANKVIATTGKSSSATPIRLGTPSTFALTSASVPCCIFWMARRHSTCLTITLSYLERTARAPRIRS